MSKFILVIGGAGYIGSHMVLALQQAGYAPIILDNLSTGHRHSIMNAKFIHGDMQNTELLNQIFSTYSFSAIMHFASFIEVAESIKTPIKYYQNNVAATINLLDVMIKSSIKNFIFSSSAAVYGESTSKLISESHVLQPVNPYGRSKFMVEEILKDCASRGEIHFSILRYFNAAGAHPEGKLCESHDPESHLIPLVLQAASGQRESITIFGNDYPTEDGTCIRDYVHVMDICNAHLLALQAMEQGRKNLILNLGTGKGHSVLEVIKAARKVSGKEIPLQMGRARNGDPAILVADAKLAKQELQWLPKYPALETIITHAWKAFAVKQMKSNN